jgi:hypothetical protein
MRGITRWVLIFDAERFGEKNCAQKRSLNCGFNFQFWGCRAPYASFSFPAGSRNLFLFSSRRQPYDAQKLAIAAASIISGC